MNLVENRSAKPCIKNSKGYPKTSVSLCFVDILSSVCVSDTEASLLLYFMKFVMFMTFDIPNFCHFFLFFCSVK